MSSTVHFIGEDGCYLSHTMFFASTKAKDLKTPGVCHQRAIPAHEFMEPSHLFYEVFARLKVEVVGIGDDHLSADFAKLLL